MAMQLSAADRFVTFTEQANAQSLKGATIGFSAQEPKAVEIAAANLQDDFLRVMGFRPTTANQPTILIGTVGFNKQIDQWVKSGKLADLKGKREKFVITTIDGQVVIAGSDRRGTVYGIYELSRQMGVSPWYWWMDVPVIKQVTKKPASKTTQVWALYKEVLDYYDKGMRVPDDVIMLLCDDNWGNVRRVPNAKERKHPGGWGLFYTRLPQCGWS